MLHTHDNIIVFTATKQIAELTGNELTPGKAYAAQPVHLINGKSGLHGAGHKAPKQEAERKSSKQPVQPLRVFQKVTQFLWEHPTSLMHQIEFGTKLDQKYIRSALKTGRKAGLIKTTGQRRGTRYSMVAAD